MVKPIIGGIFLAALITPALAADEYWVEYNYSTHECSIVEKKTQETASDPTQDTTTAPTQDTTTAAPTQDTPTSDPTQDTTTAETPKDAATAETPKNAPEAGRDTTAADGTTDNSADPTAAVAAAWARKEAAARESHRDITKTLVGSPMRSRKEAEEEMAFIRRCPGHR